MDFTDKDEQVLGRLAALNEARIDDVYAQLVAMYVRANSHRVTRLYEADAALSGHLIEDRPIEIQQILADMDTVDLQSMFAFRIYGIINTSSDSLIQYFRSQRNSVWVRQRFLYPLVYYKISMPDDGYIDTFLSFVIPDGPNAEVRTGMIKTLLNDTVVAETTASFKFFIALMCHPFDACEILLNHIEYVFARDGTLSSSLLEALMTVQAAAPNNRADQVRRIVDRTALPLRPQVSEAALIQNLSVGPSTAAFLSRVMSMSWAPSRDPPPPTPTPTRLQEALKGLCDNRYPSFEDFITVTSSARRWGFTAAGRFLRALCASLYMVEREPRSLETRDLLRLCFHSGAVTPYLLASPRGGEALDRNLISIERASRTTVVAQIDAAIASPDRYANRAWIKAAHWRLRLLEKDFRYTKWLQAVRRYIPVAPPPYLSGIDWAFVGEIINTQRIAPFEGDPAGIYVLLLMQLEDRSAEATPLRTAIEPNARGKSVAQFVGWLINEYADASVAFIRYFFTPEHILMLRLANNQTAALAARVEALEHCVRSLGFGPLITAAQFEDEYRQLNSALLLRRIGEEQFEVPWGAFRRDMLDKDASRFEAYLGFRSNQTNASSILTGAKLETVHRYKNGRTVTYNFTYGDWPLATLLTGIVESFINHPSFGIQVLLSNRFRHDTMRKEFGDVFTRMTGANLRHTHPQVKAAILTEMEEPVLLQVQAWLDRHLQTRRTSRPDAIFDFAPDQSDLMAIVQSIDDPYNIEGILDAAIGWLKSCLFKQVTVAREKFLSEVPDLLAQALRSEEMRLLSCGDFRMGDVTAVAAALRSSLLHEVERLARWFGTSNDLERQPLAIVEIKEAVDGLYERLIGEGKLKILLARCGESQDSIPAEKVRLAFDLFSEIYRNAIKHAPEPGVAQVRIRPFRAGGQWGFVFSSPTSPGEAWRKSIEGRRYESVHDEVFREGNSGLPKVASLAASIIEASTTILAIRRGSYFRLVVPFGVTTEV